MSEHILGEGEELLVMIEEARHHPAPQVSDAIRIIGSGMDGIPHGTDPLHHGANASLDAVVILVVESKYS